LQPVFDKFSTKVLKKNRMNDRSARASHALSIDIAQVDSCENESRHHVTLRSAVSISLRIDTTQ
jgi:hypothetical protein